MFKVLVNLSRFLVLCLLFLDFLLFCANRRLLCGLVRQLFVIFVPKGFTLALGPQFGMHHPMNDPTAALAGMLPFDSIGLYEQPKPRFIFKMPRVVPDQKSKFESDELFRRLSRESEVPINFLTIAKSRAVFEGDGGGTFDPEPWQMLAT